MENNELTQNQILIEIKRISKNIQFFFWLTIASIGFSLITAIYFSSGFNDSTSRSNDSTEISSPDKHIINRDISRTISAPNKIQVKTKKEKFNKREIK